MITVAILDGQTIQALPVAKSLKKLGYYVILLCETKNSYGYNTKYADKRLIFPSTKKDNISNYHESLMQLIVNNKIDVIIPMNDDSARYMSLYKKQIATYTNCIIPNYKTFMKGYDKNQLMNLCFENNFPHPRTIDLSIPEIEIAHANISFPALIKPNETSGARGFAIVNSVEKMRSKLPQIVKEYGNCHLQEYIPPGGKQFKVELFVYKKELINSTVIHKMRFYPEKGGSSCFNQTIDRKDLVQLCYKVLKKINWEGFADFDLIEDPRDNIIKIMEINPRIPACIKASYSAGVDFAENIVSTSLKLTPKKFNYTPGTYLRYLGLDFLWFVKSKNRFKTKPKWFNQLFSSHQSLQDGSLDDLKPFIYGTIGSLLKQLDPRFRATKKGMN
ncbi:ATP-grasp domain-containing protein [uncultured Draconibacterium sp.]|uniref:carboxylate--amine ligase n=1 Tax=uncultured Draconibacterium sp. TaxID=1573823 RepID=UPI0029C72141|nr:ATP-grasp domain-containing protein [uncultured Draconibacterium sp.]